MGLRYGLLVSLVLLLTTETTFLRSQDIDLLFYDEYSSLPNIELMDQRGRSIRFEDFKGKVCIASFFFSTCPKCPTKHLPNLVRLYEKLKSNSDILFVTISVNPKDDPKRLAEFAQSYNADPDKWLFLTGSEEDIYKLSQETFQQGLRINPEPNDIDHTFRFFVIDHWGRIRGSVQGTDESEVQRFSRRVQYLVQAKYLPSINASLNGISGLILVIGIIAIKNRKITFHKICMLSALLVSTLFLASYLYYHFVVIKGQVTTFSGDGIVKVIYLCILGSHTILAAFVAPLAIITSILGLRNKLDKHKNFGKITFPLWLYVSVTGVIVYLMLYHLYPPG